MLYPSCDAERERGVPRPCFRKYASLAFLADILCAATSCAATMSKAASDGVQLICNVGLLPLQISFSSFFTLINERHNRSSTHFHAFLHELSLASSTRPLVSGTRHSTKANARALMTAYVAKPPASPSAFVSERKEPTTA